MRDRMWGRDLPSPARPPLLRRCDRPRHGLRRTSQTDPFEEAVDVRSVDVFHAESTIRDLSELVDELGNAFDRRPESVDRRVEKGSTASQVRVRVRGVVVLHDRSLHEPRIEEGRRVIGDKDVGSTQPPLEVMLRRISQANMIRVIDRRGEEA